MSTDYRPKNAITINHLFDGCLERFGIREYIEEGETSDTARCLTDGRNGLWVYGDQTVDCISLYGLGNAPEKILAAIEETFDTVIYSEYEPQYWGFDTQEEWDLAEMKRAKENEESFYTDVIKYIRGEPNDLWPGTIGMIKANIAKDLIAENPRLADPERKAELMEAINVVYESDHAVVLKLSDQGMAVVKMAMTHEDELPQA